MGKFIIFLPTQNRYAGYFKVLVLVFDDGGNAMIKANKKFWCEFNLVASSGGDCWKGTEKN